MGVTQQVSVDVPVRLQVMQSSIEDMKRVLNNLKPDSSGFNKLSKIIQDMTKYMEQFQVQTSKSFSSQTQFNQAGKTLDKMEESLERAKIAISGIKFDDLKITPEQQQTFDDLKQKISEVTKEYQKAKDAARDSILGDTKNRKLISDLDVNLVSKDFDVIIKKLDKEVERLNQRVYEAQKKLTSVTDEATTKQGRIDKLTTTGISEDSLGPELFNKFFWNTKRGIQFRTVGFAAGEVKKQFLEALKAEFKLSDADIDELVNAVGTKDTFAAFNKAFMAMSSGGTNIFSGVSKGLTDAVHEQTEKTEKELRAQRDYAKLQQEMHDQYARDDDGNAIGNLAQKQDEYTGEVEKGTAAIKAQEEALRDQARAAASSASGTDEMKTQLQGFRDELTRTNSQFLQLQRSQRTFNSIKMAITNFMGFNQVLNLTKRAVQEAANHIKQLDSTMNGIAIVTDMTTADLWNQVGAYSEMAQKYGTTIQGAYEVSKIYYQAGYETNDVLTLMNETLKLSKISGLDYATTTDYMMTATRGFHMEVSEAARVVDVYSALAANTAVSQQELAEAMTRTASSMEAVGATFEEASAMIATMVAVTRESANNIGSALKSIGSRFGELTKDPAKLLDSEGEAMSFNKVDEALKSVGITLQTTDHQFRDFTDVIMELAEVWNTLDSAQQRY